MMPSRDVFPARGRVARGARRRPARGRPIEGRGWQRCTAGGERLEGRALLAVTAALVGSDLQIDVQDSDTAYVRLDGGTGDIEVASDASFTSPVYAGAASNVATISVTGATGGSEGFSVEAGIIAVTTLISTDVERVAFAAGAGVDGEVVASNIDGVYVDGLSAVDAVLSSSDGKVELDGVVEVTGLLRVEAFDDIVQSAAGEINAGRVVALVLPGSVAGDVVLTNSLNTIAQFEASNQRSGGSISVASDAAMLIGVAELGGISTLDGEIRVSAQGTISQAVGSAVSAAALVVEMSDGDMVLEESSNSVASFAATSTGSIGVIRLATSSDLVIGVGSDGIAFDGKAVTLTASGSVTQAPGCNIVAGVLLVNADGDAIELGSTANQVTAFAARNVLPGGSVRFVNGQPLTIGAAGISTDNGAITVEADGPIVVQGPLDYGTGTLTLLDYGSPQGSVTFVVFSDADSGAGTLRDRLQQVHDNASASQDTAVRFDASVNGVALQTPLAAISTPVTIDGEDRHVELNGSLIVSGPANGLVFADGAQGSRVSRLSIGGFLDAGVRIEAPSVSVASSLIGLAADGTLRPNGVGVLVTGENAQAAVIGEAAQGNTISGNTGDGIRFEDGAAGGTVLGNTIGLGLAGEELGNGGNGIAILGSGGTIIGGAATDQRNLVSANSGSGILVTGASGGVVIQGNWIGLSADGTAAAGNGSSGVVVSGPDASAQIGTTAAGNVISGNDGPGVMVNDESSATVVFGNLIGLDADGLAPVGNAGDGILIDNAVATSLAANTVSGNAGDGISVTGAASSATVIRGNTIGLSLNGDAPVSNAGVGIRVTDVPSVVIGGGAGTDRNTVSGNGSHGILVVSTAGTGSAGVSISSNYVGTDTSGSTAVGNVGDGIRLEGVDSASVTGNLVSGNQAAGVRVTGDSMKASIAANIVGLDALQTVAVGNLGDGIVLEGGAGHFVGGTSADANVVAGNQGAGILISGGTGVDVQGNVVGTNATGGSGLGNAGDGISIVDADGTTVRSNLSSGNGGSGVSVAGSEATVIVGNRLGTGSTGITAVPNQQHGVAIAGGAETTVGGVVDTDRNIISGNVGRGILVDGSSATAILGNYVGVTSNGYSALGNRAGGMLVSEATDTTISGGNVIAFNGSDASGHGVAIVGGSGTTVGDQDTGLSGGNAIFRNRGDGIRIELGAAGTVVVGNSIGSTAAGTVGLGNDGAGVAVVAVNGTTIGGLRSAAGAPSLGNLIVGNGGSGVLIRDALPDTAAGEAGNRIHGNTIRRNRAAGVSIEASSSQEVGGTATTLGNEIGENFGDGVRIDNTAGGLGGHVVVGNAIGSDASGSQRLGNLGDGISIVASVGNTIGGIAGSGNTISFNRAGVVASGAVPASADEGNVIAGNTIASNVGDGVRLEACSLTTVGTATDLPANVVVLNGGTGVAVTGGSDNLVIGNLIGTDSIGGVKANGRQGVLITASEQNSVLGNTIAWNRLGGVRVAAGSDNVIGGAGVESNAIRANGGPGVILAAGTSGNMVHGNLVRGNTGGGVSVVSSVGNLIDGGNVVVRNQKFGIAVTGGADNVIEGNFVGTNSAETAQLGNLGPGIVVTGGVGTAVGTARGNTVRFNGGDGIQLVNAVAATADGASSVVNNTSSSNAGNGLSISGGSLVAVTGNTLGGLASGAGNGRSGISIVAGASGIVLTRNRVDGNATTGAELIGAVDTALGSDDTDDTNFFTGNRSDGVRLSGGSVGTAIGLNDISGNGGDGIEINAGVRNAVYGATISGNGGSGVAIVSAKPASPADGNEIADATIRNNAVGIAILGSAGTRVTGGTVSDSRGAGVLVAAKSTQTTIRETSIMGSRGSGVEINASRSTQVVGATISGGAAAGILLSQASGASAADANVLTGNDVFGNAGSGISLVTSSFNTIGGGGVSDSNFVHGNRGHGVAMRQGSSSNILLGNFVGLDPGKMDDGNALDGVRIAGGFGNVIGEGTMIAANAGAGVSVLDSFAATAATGNRVEGAVIQANGGTGILLNGGAHIVGGTIGNTIDGNGGDGVAVITGSGVSKIAGPTIAANTIVGNAGNGVSLSGVTGAVVSENSIGDHAGAGIVLVGGLGNRVASNLVGGARGANVTGIAIAAGASQNVVVGNEISANEGDGISITGARSSDNLIGVRSAGLGETGVANRVFANLGAGIRVTKAVRNQVAGNSIFGNAGGGIVLQDGGNSTQPSPTLASAKRVVVAGRSQVQVSGEVRGGPRQQVVIDFFRNDPTDGDPATRTGYQSRAIIGRVTVVLDAAGKGTFTTTLAADVPVGNLLTAVATTASGVVGNASQQSAVAVPV